MDAAVEVSLSGRKMKRAFVDTVKTQLRQHGTVKIVLPRAGAFPRYGLVHMRLVHPVCSMGWLTPQLWRLLCCDCCVRFMNMVMTWPRLAFLCNAQVLGTDTTSSGDGSGDAARSSFAVLGHYTCIDKLFATQFCSALLAKRLGTLRAHASCTLPLSTCLCNTHVCRCHGHLT